MFFISKIKNFRSVIIKAAILAVVLTVLYFLPNRFDNQYISALETRGQRGCQATFCVKVEGKVPNVPTNTVTLPIGARDLFDSINNQIQAGYDYALQSIPPIPYYPIEPEHREPSVDMLIEMREETVNRTEKALLENSDCREMISGFDKDGKDIDAVDLLREINNNSGLGFTRHYFLDFESKLPFPTDFDEFVVALNKAFEDANVGMETPPSTIYRIFYEQFNFELGLAQPPRSISLSLLTFGAEVHVPVNNTPYYLRVIGNRNADNKAVVLLHELAHLTDPNNNLHNDLKYGGGNQIIADVCGLQNYNEDELFTVDVLSI